MRKPRSRNYKTPCKLVVRYTVEDTSRIAEDRRREGRPDPQFDDLDKAIWYAFGDLHSWTDGSGHYVIHRLEMVDCPTPKTRSTPNADGMYQVLDLVTIVGFVCCDRTGEYQDMVYLGVDGTVLRVRPADHVEERATACTI